MSYWDYRASQHLEVYDYSFYALIMAAMRKADTENYAWLRHAFPLTESELNDRYNLPGGRYESEQEVSQTPETPFNFTLGYD